MPEYKRSKIHNRWVFFLLSLMAVWLSRHHVFFWDTVQLGSKQAHWYYDHGFRYWLLPDVLDSGHPPFFGLYLASLWQLAGRSLPISHFAMFPFLWGILLLAYRAGGRLAGPARAWMFPLFLIVDPVAAGQGVLISPDLILLFAFLLGWDAIETGKRFRLSLAVALLGLISMRGMMVAFALFVYELLAWQAGDSGARRNWRHPLRLLIAYLPGGLLGGGFLLWHYLEKGWIGYHPDSPWAPNFVRVGLEGVLYNGFILGWRLLDFGRLFIWAGLFVLAIFRFRENRLFDGPGRKLLLLLLSTLLVLLPSMLLHRSITAHRYLLPIMVVLSFLFAHWVFSATKPARKWRYALIALALAGLLTGNRWIYPRKIAQGWDATLAHWPYYALRDQMLAFIDERGIPLSRIGAAFPEIGPLRHRDLSNRWEGMKAYDLEKQDYIFYSNIMNDFSDAALEELSERWRMLKRLERGGVEVILYARPAPEKFNRRKE